jgi:DNA mismatch repair protein MutS2
MNDQSFGILEFDELRALVRRHAQTVMGAVRIAAVAPVPDLHELQRALKAVAECVELRARGVRWSFDGLADPGEAISRLKIEHAALGPSSILDLARLCEGAMDARAGLLAERDNCHTLFAVVAELPRDLSNLPKRIAKKILPSGELDDRASPELARIRGDITRLRSRITRALEKVMRRSPDAIQDELVTVRNDRFVIPVRADHQARVNGVAHGFSSSGATAFVEPMETIEANNELQALREAEEREIARILFELSEELRRELPAIEVAAAAVTELDFVGAKAGFAERFQCVVPSIAGTEPLAVASGPPADRRTIAASKRIGGAIGESSTLEFIEARHPLLEESLRVTGGSVVSVSFKLDHEHAAMVISGANAGGKTVVLKTAGLLALMALSGLPVPAREARVPCYRSILADIGDHQSLAANLSTFTSHIANIACMIELCAESVSRGADILSAFPDPIGAPRALVLLDEVGTGTDPEEGSALGVAVVDSFKKLNAQVMATTHYAGLKMYAANEPGVLNASVEFDEKTLRPTYRLLVGVAGSSSGLEIAHRFGIPKQVIESASAIVKDSSRQAIEYLARIKREADEAAILRAALEEERAAVAEKYASLEKAAQQRERERQANFERELAKATASFEARSRELIAEIEDRAGRVKIEREAQQRAAELKREAQVAAKAARKLAQAPLAHGPEVGLPPQLRGVRVVRDGKVISEGGQTGRGVDLSNAEDIAPAELPSSEESGQDARAPRVGDRVRLRSFGSVGIVDEIKGDEAQVRVGSLHMREKFANLELVRSTGVSSVNPAQEARGVGTRAALAQRAKTTEVHLHGSESSQSGSKARTELNLIGKTTDEGMDLADKFLDEAFMDGLREVRIIHGHGTGALRRMIADLLKDHPHVARFASAPREHGGDGATIVELRE